MLTICTLDNHDSSFLPFLEKSGTHKSRQKCIKNDAHKKLKREVFERERLKKDMQNVV